MSDAALSDSPTPNDIPWKVSWIPRVRKVLACVDFSPSGEALAKTAVALVNQHWLAKLTLLHVVPPASWLQGSSPERVKAGKELMKKLCSAWEEDSQPDAVVVEGQPAQEICHVAEEMRADLILLASHGRTGIRRAFWGSIAEAVVHKARCSVLVLKPGVPSADPAASVPARTQRIAVAFDGSDGAKAALSVALKFARHGAEKIILIQALNPSSIEVPPYSGFGDADEQLESARKDMLEWAERIGHDLEVQVILDVGAPWRVLTDAVENLGVDLLVMGAHHKWRMGQTLLGTVCERTVRHAACSVLIVKPAGR